MHLPRHLNCLPGQGNQKRSPLLHGRKQEQTLPPDGSGRLVQRPTPDAAMNFAETGKYSINRSRSHFRDISGRTDHSCSLVLFTVQPLFYPVNPPLHSSADKILSAICPQLPYCPPVFSSKIESKETGIAQTKRNFPPLLIPVTCSSARKKNRSCAHFYVLLYIFITI